MPKIRWKDLPPALRDHLFERLRERKISAGRIGPRLWLVKDQVDVLELAARAFEGLSPGDICEVEEMARRRPLFADARSEGDQP